jgi:hypothetical protein
MLWLCTKQKGLLCAYQHYFGDNYIITIVSTGLTTKKYSIVLLVLNLVSDFVKCNRPIGTARTPMLQALFIFLANFLVVK